MTPDEPDLARDSVLQALSALPRGDLDAWRSQRLRARAHAELARSSAPRARWRMDRALEPLLLGACGLLGLARLASAIVLIMSH